MNVRVAVAAVISLALWTPPSVAAAGPPQPGETRVTVADGIVLGLSMSGVSSTAALSAAVRVHDGDVYRLIVDESGQARFAYAIRLDLEGQGVEVVFRPVRLHEAARAFSPRQATYTLPFRLGFGLVTLPDIQRSGAVSAGDSVTIDLFDNRDTGQRIGDAVRVIAVSPQAIARLTAVRRHAVEARPELTVAGMTIRRDGQVLNLDSPGTFATGHTIGVALGANRGTVVFSAEAPQNEVPAGVAQVDGRTIRFTLDGHEYECTGTEPIGPPGLTSVWMYVFHEPLPFGAGFAVLAGDSVDGFMKAWRRRP